MGKPTVKLIGEDGNVFAIIGAVKKALRNAGLVEESKQFVAKAFVAASYDEVLRICGEYVDIK